MTAAQHAIAHCCCSALPLLQLLIYLLLSLLLPLHTHYSVAEIQRKQQRTTSLRPLAAYGPPAGTSQENVSVVKSTLAAGFSLRGTLGAPREAAERLLSTAIAPEGSGREWQLLSARVEQRRGVGDSSDQQQQQQQQEVYRFEYTIKVRETAIRC
jgi:PsbP